MDKELEFIPKDGTYALPYVANAAGILYNKDLFEENGWKVPTIWQEFTILCDELTLPLPLGMGSVNVIVAISLFQMTVMNKKEEQL